MPRPGPRMPQLSFRMPAGEIEAVEQVAGRERVSKSEAARLLMAYAAPRMPEGWRPAPDEAPKIQEARERNPGNRADRQEGNRE